MALEPWDSKIASTQGTIKNVLNKNQKLVDFYSQDTSDETETEWAKKLLVRWSDVQDDFQFKSIRKEREYSAKIRKSKAVSNIKPNFAHSFMDRLQISLFILSEFINLFPPEIIRVQGK